MINDVVIEGIVVRDPWKFMEDLFFRLVVYRDSDLPSKKLDQEHDAGDYINVRVNGGANGLIHIRRGMRLRVHGFFQSRDYRESLEEFISKARKSKNLSELAVEIKGCEFKPGQIQIDRNVVEVVARRIIVLERPNTAPVGSLSETKGETDDVKQSKKKPRSAARKVSAPNGDTDNHIADEVSTIGDEDLTKD
ncbi:MAG: hypothetical protein RBT64_14480 [Trichloromonas sp.]|nr:hypothetical protein [Trichloromonas sp.]